MIIRILIVEKQRSIRNVLQEKLQFEGYFVKVAEDLDSAFEIQKEEEFNLVIADDLAFNQYVAKHGEIEPTLEVIVMAETRSIDEAVQFIRAGAIDYVAKPLDMNHLLGVIKELQEDKLRDNIGSVQPSAEPPKKSNQRKRRSSAQQLTEIIGNSSSIMHVKSLIDKVALSDARVLVLGENGTGKELVAKSLHEKSHRHSAPFVEVNCAAIPSELIESELFGHEKGAFTSAIKQRKGKFEQASGGTLFLDEIGDMSASAQAKVLRVLQEKRICRVGGDVDILVDVRVIAATNKDLREEIKRGNFREDLYHRLSVIVIQVPSLLDRVDDIPVLTDHFMEDISEEYGIDQKKIEKGAIERLKTMRWNGNVRELRNVVERLIILSGDVITTDDIDKYVSGTVSRAGVMSNALKESRRLSVEKDEEIEVEI